MRGSKWVPGPRHGWPTLALDSVSWGEKCPPSLWRRRVGGGFRPGTAVTSACWSKGRFSRMLASSASWILYRLWPWECWSWPMTCARASSARGRCIVLYSSSRSPPLTSCLSSRRAQKYSLPCLGTAQRLARKSLWPAFSLGIIFFSSPRCHSFFYAKVILIRVASPILKI